MMTTKLSTTEVLLNTRIISKQDRTENSAQLGARNHKYHQPVSEAEMLPLLVESHYELFLN